MGATNLCVKVEAVEIIFLRRVCQKKTWGLNLDHRKCPNIAGGGRLRESIPQE
jgi:hypothetical protein